MGKERGGEGPRLGARVRRLRVRSPVGICLPEVVLGAVVAPAGITFNT
ncbi:hypothetical protein SRB17_70650 [Streptomyces sp. RB17]|nr:hypothetical protein [Streptomyces sp. RB17]MQY39043.1 hypothetical protein [Streptomyces sp. RB17]